ncbi:hypothetical protein [Amycolatopsis albispora]|uniref:Uncharacterized protein n=1 Tax=Amycolatopsis albispora TaxID=1804986 RepID=A0A344LIT7_9PSEU|nr:hypothetical protein [Amycolatopsis albispora]AXB47961.1 hypothetical protein A4R43_40540 [Amycolatopsis albispora]
MAWRVANALEALLAQLDALAPNRSRVSDGSIGDTSHQNRSSDHNPWYGPGIVTARDFTHDPGGGLDCRWLAARLVEVRDRRIKYVIWDRRIVDSRISPWVWRPYHGPNPHTGHLHLSVLPDPSCDDVTPWDLGVPVSDHFEEQSVELTAGTFVSKTLVCPSVAADLVISLGFVSFTVHHVKFFGATPESGAAELASHGEQFVDPARPYVLPVPAGALTAEILYTLPVVTPQHTAVAAFR